MKRALVVVGLMALVGAQASESNDSRFVCQKSFLDSYYFGTQFGDSYDTNLPGESRLVVNSTSQVPVNLIVIPEPTNAGYFVFGPNGLREYFPRPRLWTGAHFYRLAIGKKRFVYVNEENGNLLSVATEPHNVLPLSVKSYSTVKPLKIEAAEFDKVFEAETQALIKNTCQHYKNSINEFAYNQSAGPIADYRLRAFESVKTMFAACSGIEQYRQLLMTQLMDCKAFRAFVR